MSVIRSFRFWIMWVAAAFVVGWYFATDPDGGRETIQRLQHLLWLAVIALPVYLLRRVLVDGRAIPAYRKALQSPVGAGMVYLGIAIVTAALVLVLGARANATPLPPRALEALPVLDAEISARWPAMPLRSVLGALIEQETCPSLKHAKCWNPRTELKTHREYGFGLGQLTVAYRADGSERFNAFREVKALDRSLAGWTWENRYDARMQLRAIVVMNRDCFRRLSSLVEDSYQVMAMCDAAYNGGYGGLLSDRRLCAARAGCDPDRWFGHVELTSNKSRVKWQGYGMSAYEINRHHVRAVMVTRRPKYAEWWGEG